MTPPEVIVYFFLFTSLYVQVFLLLTFWEYASAPRKKARKMEKKLPGVTVIVPCFNEEKTIERTVESLLSLDYPAEKLRILIVDDGSTDNTWSVIRRFAATENIAVFQKQNGGKHTALNFGLERTKTELVGCLDADSYVEPGALRKIVAYFSDQSIMAVTPSIRVWKPTNWLERVQNTEYNMGIFLRKMLASLNAIHVTPGPFSIFRKKVFDIIGTYRHAYNTEDLEIALRMHKNHLRIENANDAYVYTSTPKNIRALLKQRVRWVCGFIYNTFDYRFMLLKKKYGNVSLFTLPAGILSILSVSYLTGYSLYKFAQYLVDKFIALKTVHFDLDWGNFSFDWFYVDTEIFSFLTLFLVAFGLASIFLGKKMAEGKARPNIDVFYFLALYGFLAPLWILKSVYNAALLKKTSWR